APLRMGDPLRRGVQSDDRPARLNQVVKDRGRLARTAAQIEEALSRLDPAPSGLSAYVFGTGLDSRRYVSSSCSMR
ncbi:MAG TPA: hypothetical protein PLW16_09010, partial [Syntrophales bacterium]|nr:hypothetical protein [Syntrophales bacterium]